MERSHLLTLVHISDLHIGLSENISADGIAKAAWERFPTMDGFFGHDENALIRTAEFVHELASTENARVVVTGDLTAMGRPAEFVNAKKFLTSGLTLGNKLPVGLDAADWRDRSIPGNHDHWPGSGRVPMLGTPNPALYSSFGGTGRLPLPLCDWSIPLDWPGRTRPLKLRLVGIDTDADVPPTSDTRLRARGAFQSQLTALRRSGRLHPKPESDGEIRVLLMHHSPSWEESILGIEEDSASALAQFLCAEQFSLVLTGHTHQARVRSLGLQYRGKAVDVWEACCGTTTQRIDVPYNWSSKARARRDREPRLNTLLVHRFYGERSSVVWQVHGYGLRRSKWDHCTIPPRWNLIAEEHAVWRG